MMSMDEEKVFKALADESRRKLLDSLFEHDGQTLSQLQALLPKMTRFGVMKHLQLLEDAGLLTTRKVGREKHHYLNPVPVQAVYERWVTKYAQPWTRLLTGLKDALEEPAMTPSHIFQIFIRTTPEQLWKALTSGDLSQLYYFNTRVEADWQPGKTYHYFYPDGKAMIEGEILEIDPPRRLVTTFKPLWLTEPEDLQFTRVTWLIEPAGASCKLTVTHEGLDMSRPASQGMMDGWARILSGLKTLLETGQPLGLEL
jgi:uncharacterized protein YndB with AHSA1/START domain/DNA-binding transcriptional ArsR family regulator